MGSPVLLIAVFLIAVFMTMAGRGGGNFYVLLQVLAGTSMHLAAATGQLIMAFTSFAALVVFQRSKVVAWPLALFIGLTTSVAAFFGGMLAHAFDGVALKLIFATLLVVASLLMFFPVRERNAASSRRRGTWTFTSGGVPVTVDLWIATPFSLATGFFAGMVGVSGGSFLIPLMVLACGMPMKPAVGTASVMVGATATMGFLGHMVEGGMDWNWALPQAVVAVVGGLIGGRLALATKPAVLKKVFAFTTLAAAVFMYFKTFL